MVQCVRSLVVCVSLELDETWDKSQQMSTLPRLKDELYVLGNMKLETMCENGKDAHQSIRENGLIQMLGRPPQRIYM